MNSKERKITTELAALEQSLQEEYQNSERKIAQAILDAQKMREESYQSDINLDGEDTGFGDYKLTIEDCLIATCKQQGLSKNLWALLSLAMHWWNDIQLWAEDVLAGKNILDECHKEHTKMKDEIKQVEKIANEDNQPCCESPSKEKCDQCQETGTANPNNH